MGGESNLPAGVKKSDNRLLLVEITSPRIPPPLQGVSTPLKYMELSSFKFRDAGVAQLVEQLTCNQPVGGSTPLASSISFPVCRLLRKIS